MSIIFKHKLYALNSKNSLTVNGEKAYRHGTTTTN